ncbi:unnamed protein product [Calicophoron daubneyi]|uniref:Aminoacyl-transfer RNA synthetases class-II family profile domain-containing protein n=1 Tax=Calicophoron daubneyi TaxID=300641 RepID=A0AAV2TKL9_CALDB
MIYRFVSSSCTLSRFLTRGCTPCWLMIFTASKRTISMGSGKIRIPRLTPMQRRFSEVTHAHKEISKGLELQECLMSNAKLIGWVHSIRRHKKHVFFDISDGSSPRYLQVVSPPSAACDQVVVGSAVTVEGKLMRIQKPAPNGEANSVTELHADHVCLLSQSSALTPNSENAESSEISTSSVSGASGLQTPLPDLGVLRSASGLGWRHRLPEFASMLRLRASMKKTIRSVMDDLEYLEVDTPILTSANCEGVTQSFVVQSPPSAWTNGTKESQSTPVYLTSSAQLHLEALALGLSKVYTLGPTFRAESSHTRHHLAEFHMFEVESVHLDTVDKLCNEIENITRLILTKFGESLHTTDSNDEKQINPTDMKMDSDIVMAGLSAESQPNQRRTSLTPNAHMADQLYSSLQSILVKPFVRITFSDACAYLQRSQSRCAEVHDFTKDEERQIVNGFGGGRRPVFVTQFPIGLKPFYCRSADGVHAEAADLLFPGVGELVGGSVREDREGVLRERLIEGGIKSSVFAWYLALRQHGGAPHGGFGLGFERLLQWVFGVHNIRDVIPFPRTIDKVPL